MVFDRFSIVNVPFPFTNLVEFKKRKALVLSNREFNTKNECTVLAMITSAERSSWAGDVTIDQWKEVGLRKPCLVRLKLFTIENSFLLEKIGELQTNDRLVFQKQFESYLS